MYSHVPFSAAPQDVVGLRLHVYLFCFSLRFHFPRVLRLPSGARSSLGFPALGCLAQLVPRKQLENRSKPRTIQGLSGASALELPFSRGGRGRVCPPVSAGEFQLNYREIMKRAGRGAKSHGWVIHGRLL